MRKIKDPFRLVFTGSKYGISKMFSEYRIIDGDMAEQPQTIQYNDDEHFEKEIQVLWNDSLNDIKKREKV